MKEKINIAELLKDCPKGMELDCTIWDNVVFDHIVMKSDYPIYIKKMGGEEEYLTEEGCFNFDLGAKCVIFPKGKTTWEGFVPPCGFKDGDVLYVDCTEECDDKQHDYIFIFKEICNGKVDFYCCYYIPHDQFQIKNYEALCLTDNKYPTRLATEEEKAILFKAIKDNGYKWNDETKTLEKLPKFKIGNRIKKKGTDNIYSIEISGVGDTIYMIKGGGFQYIENTDKNYELVPDKFDISTLKPFESKVLVRDYDNRMWIPAFWGKYLENNSNCSYLTTNGCYKYCIPYEGNEHLCGTIKECNEYYKIWK